MPLYLDEIWLEWRSQEQFAQTLSRFLAMGDGNFAYPEGVTVAGGPWFSNEERKIVLVLDIPDHTKTFQAFGVALGIGMLEKRRLTPVVAWNEVRQLSQTLDAMTAKS